MEPKPTRAAHAHPGLWARTRGKHRTPWQGPLKAPSSSTTQAGGVLWPRVFFKVQKRDAKYLEVGRSVGRRSLHLLREGWKPHSTFSNDHQAIMSRTQATLPGDLWPCAGPPALLSFPLALHHLMYYSPDLLVLFVRVSPQACKTRRLRQCLMFC